MNDEHENNQSAPTGFVEDLRALDRREVFVPPTVDEQVLCVARTHLERIRRTVAKRRTLPWMALAASIVVTAALLILLGQSSFTKREFAAEDVNRDHRVDILDAFTLAQLIESGGTLERQWDINGDGTIDRRDVETIAAHAVTLADSNSGRRHARAAEPKRFGMRIAAFLFRQGREGS